MMESLQTAATRGSAQAVELLSHYCLGDDPARTLQALQVFFPRRAGEYCEALQAGRAVRVESEEIVALVGQLAAQGFRVRLVD